MLNLYLVSLYLSVPVYKVERKEVIPQLLSISLVMDPRDEEDMVMLSLTTCHGTIAPNRASLFPQAHNGHFWYPKCHPIQDSHVFQFPVFIIPSKDVSVPT